MSKPPPCPTGKRQFETGEYAARWARYLNDTQIRVGRAEKRHCPDCHWFHVWLIPPAAVRESRPRLRARIARQQTARAAKAQVAA